jgi:hypothetical protein
MMEAGERVHSSPPGKEAKPMADIHDILEIAIQPRPPFCPEEEKLLTLISSGDFEAAYGKSCVLEDPEGFAARMSTAAGKTARGIEMLRNAFERIDFPDEPRDEENTSCGGQSPRTGLGIETNNPPARFLEIFNYFMHLKARIAAGAPLNLPYMLKGSKDDPSWPKEKFIEAQGAVLSRTMPWFTGKTFILDRNDPMRFMIIPYESSQKGMEALAQAHGELRRSCGAFVIEGKNYEALCLGIERMCRTAALLKIGSDFPADSERRPGREM